MPDFETGGRRIAWFFGLVGVAFAAAAAWAAADASGLASDGLPAVARVVAVHEEERRLQVGESGYTRGAVRAYEVPELEFATREGRRVRVRGTAGEPGDWGVGEEVGLRYLPRDPTVVEFDRGDRWFLAGLFAVFGVACLLPLLLMVVLPTLRRRR